MVKEDENTITATTTIQNVVEKHTDTDTHTHTHTNDMNIFQIKIKAKKYTKNTKHARI